MRFGTGQDKSWTARRVRSLREIHGIHAYRSAEKTGQWLTLSEAARARAVSHHTIRCLIHDGDSDLLSERFTALPDRRCGPCRQGPQSQLPLFSDT